MSNTQDPFAPNPEETPEDRPPAEEVEAERVESGRSAEHFKTIDASEEPAKQSGSTQTWVIFAHLGPLIFLLAGISMPLVFLVPLVLLHTVASGDRELEGQAKEALNFHLNVAVAAVAMTMTCVLIPLLVPLWITALVLGLIATFKAANDEPYQYPWIYRVVE